MIILVLGGCGLQDCAAVFDLAGSAVVKEVVCADANPSGLDHFHSHVDVSMVRTAHVDAADSDHLRNIFTGMDVVIDLLPGPLYVRPPLMQGLVLSIPNYAHTISEINDAAKQAGIAIMPECGLDPGIDFIIHGEACGRFDELHVIDSYCGGVFPRRRPVTILSITNFRGHGRGY